MKKDRDAFGQQLLAQYNSQKLASEFIERDDNYIDIGSDSGLYFFEFKNWDESEKRAVGFARGRILDVGCGAGRHALYLQKKGFDVTAIDNSPGAIEVCKLRGVKRALVRSIAEVDKFKPASFDCVLMLGNNFGLVSNPKKAKTILKKFARITSPEAKIIAGTRDPYMTDDPNHLQYHELNRRRGRMPGQIRIRVRYGKIVGEWMDYLFVSPEEMREILSDTAWRIKEFLNTEDANYIAVIEKRSL